MERLLPRSSQTNPPSERQTRFHAVEQDKRLNELTELPELSAVLREVGCTSLVASDVNRLVGDSFWHSDGYYTSGRFLRAVVYGEPLTAASGALRVLPGTHRDCLGWSREDVSVVLQHQRLLGLAGPEVPAVALESEIGDLILFDTNILHSSWGGAVRRQWAWNFARPPSNKQERQAAAAYVLNRFVSGSVRFS